MDESRIVVSRYISPCGPMLLGSYGEALCLCDWQNNRHRLYIDKSLCISLKSEYEVGSSTVIEYARCQLDEYFGGRRTVFDVPIVYVGSDFRKGVLKTLSDVRYGTTVSYADIAAKTGSRRAVRAVANAIGANPISIMVPCHRVIGTNGDLTGYAGGLNVKKYLLELEKSNLKETISSDEK